MHVCMQVPPSDLSLLGKYTQERLKVANKTGILDLKGCGSDDTLQAAAKTLPAVYVLDVRHNR